MKIRITILVIIISFIFLFKIFPCIRVKYYKYSEYPINILKIRGVFILYGKVINCDSCTSGKVLNQYGKRTDIVFFIPQNYSEKEIENFKYSFNICGYVRRGDFKTVKYLKLVAKCSHFEDWQQNIYINIIKGKMVRI